MTAHACTTAPFLNTLLQRVPKRGVELTTAISALKEQLRQRVGSSVRRLRASKTAVFSRSRRVHRRRERGTSLVHMWAGYN